MAPSLDTLDGKKLYLVDVGFANSDNFMAQLHGGSRSTARPSARRSCGGTTSTSPTRISASASRPTATRPSSASAPDRAARRRSPATSSISSRSTGPHRGRARARVRAPRAQHREDERDAERTAGVRADTVHEHLAGGVARVRGGQRSDPRPAVHGRGLRPAHASDPDGELRGEGWDRSTPRYVEADSEAEMHALFQERRYTDFLPIVLPTEERVEQMLTGTSHAPDEMVGKLRPTIGMEYWHFDVEKVAVNAVMAGAAPEHFPSSSRSPRAATRAPEQHVLDGEHGRRQRADPAGDRHEQRRRRTRALQLRELRDRARLRPALAEPPGRIGARRDVRRLAGLQLLLQLHHVRGERGGEPLGAVPPAVRLRRRTRAPSRSRTSGATSGPNTCAPTGRRSSRR